MERHQLIGSLLYHSLEWLSKGSETVFSISVDIAVHAGKARQSVLCTA
jgi:hypothetical protein